MPCPEPRLRVLFVTRKWPPAVGGMESYCRHLTEGLEARTELTVRALPGRSDGGPPSAPSLLGFGLSAAWHLICRARRYDVIHLGDMALWPLATIASMTGSRARLVASAHGTDVAFALRPGIGPRLYGLYLGIGGAVARRLKPIANSFATAAHCERYGFEPAAVVPLGVETQAGRPPPTDPEPYVLFVGRLARRKGCAWFIRHVLPGLEPGIRLVVAAVEWDRDEAASLSADRVDYLGPVHGERLAELRRRALAVVVPNVRCGGRDFEGFGLTAVEAAADGGLLLASRVDGLVDAVVDGITGFLLPPEEPAAWIDKLHELSEWPRERRRAFVDGAFDRVERDFSWQRVTEQTLELYVRPGHLEPIES